MASILNVFEPKTKILSAEVNENFELVQADVAEMGRALNTFIEGELTSLQSNLSSAQATLQENINAVQATANAVYTNIAPNYGAGYYIGDGFVAPVSGWCHLEGATDGHSYVHINGVFLEVSFDTGDGQSSGCLFVFLEKGSTIHGFSRIKGARFFPCKGVQ